MARLELELNTLKGQLAYLKANPKEDTYTGWNSLADCKCKKSEELFIKIMELESK